MTPPTMQDRLATLQQAGLAFSEEVIAAIMGISISDVDVGLAGGSVTLPGSGPAEPVDLDFVDIPNSDMRGGFSTPGGEQQLGYATSAAAVYFRGFISGGAIGANDVAFILQSAATPPLPRRFLVAANGSWGYAQTIPDGNGKQSQVNVYASGAGGNGVSFDGVWFSL